MFQSSTSRRLLCEAAAAIALATAASAASAAIVLQSTRVIFDGRMQEASLQVANEGQEEALIQSWIAPNNENEDTPFALSPPLARIPPKGTQLLRVMYEGSGLPTDRETVAWLHVQDVPRQSEYDNALQFAVRHAVKVFYRPKGLAGSPSEAPAQLNWRLSSDGDAPALEVNNPSPFHVSIPSVRVKEGAGFTEMADSIMIAPFSTQRIRLPARVTPSSLMRFFSINDFGGTDTFEARLDAAAPVRAKAVTDKEG